MIPISLREIATIVGGAIDGDDAVTVTGPAVLDGRAAEPGGLFVAFDGEHVDGHEYAHQAAAAGAVAVLGSRHTTLPTVVVGDTKAALQSLASHVIGELRDKLTVTGVTGSQGKTSTKDLLTAVLSSAGSTTATIGNLNNELGVPITALRADANTRYLIVEMGARRVGDIAALAEVVAPDIAVVLNVGKAHLGEFGSREAIARGKSELVQGLTSGGTAILNADDPRVLSMRGLTHGPVLTFGEMEHADVRVLDLSLDLLGRSSFTLQAGNDTVPVQLPLVGAHQAMNAAAAAGAGLAAGVSLEAAASALANVSLTKGRMQLIELSDGITLIDDSYNASPGSTRASLDALAAIEGVRRIAVLGEILELGDASEAEHFAAGRYAAGRADIVVAIGEPTRPLAIGAGDRGVLLADNDAAIDWLRGQLEEGDVVLVKGSRGARLDEVASALRPYR